MSRVELESVETRNKLRVEEEYKRISRGGFFLFPPLKFLSEKQKGVIK